MSTKVTIGTEITNAAEAIRVVRAKLQAACGHLTSAAQLARKLGNERLAMEISSQADILAKASTATTSLSDQLLRLANMAYFQMNPQENKESPTKGNTTHLRQVK